MSKPARLYPKPEPMTIDTKFMLVGCGISSAVFFVLGIACSNILTGGLI